MVKFGISLSIDVTNAWKVVFNLNLNTCKDTHCLFDVIYISSFVWRNVKTFSLFLEIVTYKWNRGYI